jgi:hypothetical protein
MADRAKLQDKASGLKGRLTQVAQFDALSHNDRLLYLTSLWVQDEHGPEAQWKGYDLGEGAYGRI